MNVKVGASAFNATLCGEVVEPKVSTCISYSYGHGIKSAVPCPTFAIISLNGHSLNAINPDFRVGELTTLNLA